MKPPHVNTEPKRRLTKLRPLGGKPGPYTYEPKPMGLAPRSTSKCDRQMAASIIILLVLAIAGLYFFFK